MNCREAQALIVPFVEGQLDDEQNEKFIAHIETCSECYDELEVYYIVIVGTKQLDEDTHSTMNFSENLKTYISYVKENLSRKHSRKTRRRFSSFAFAIICIVVAGFVWYSLYTHPDLVARNYYSIADSFDLDVEQAYGNPNAVIESDRIYFDNVHLDMPLRRIRVDK